MHRSHKVHVSRNKDTKSLRLDESAPNRIWITIKMEDGNQREGKEGVEGYIHETKTKEKNLNCPLHQ
jgi:hypothetical protein